MSDGITYSQSGTGDPLVFLHGIGGDARSFHHQMDAFPGYCTIAWNMPGYQGSEVRMSPPDFAHLSQRLAAFVQRLGGPVHLAGQSIGGMIALTHALDHPAQVASLTLITTTPRFGGRDDSFKTAFLKARLDPLDAGQSMAEMAARTAPHLVGRSTDPTEIKQIETVLADVPQSTWRDILQCLVTFDRADELQQVTCPVLVIAGSEDRNAPAKTMEKMAKRLRDARFHMVDGAGHMLHQERPKTFNSLLTDFLNEIAAT